MDKKDVLNSDELEESFEFSQQVISHCSVEVVDKKDVLNSDELEESFEFSQQVISHSSVCYFTVISKVTL